MPQADPLFRARSVGADFKSGNVIVHFGMPKTGSTSIHESLFQNLSDPGFHYVNLGGANASLGIVTAFKATAARFHVHVKRGTSPEELLKLKRDAVERLTSELRCAGARTALLCGEAISGLQETELRDLFDCLARHRHAIAAVGYVRRPKEYMESIFQQKVKGGMHKFHVSGLAPRYQSLSRKFDVVLGRENVRLWLFDPKTFPRGCVVQDFCARLGIDFPPDGVIRVNEGLSLPALSLLFAYRKFGPGFGVGPNVLRENRRLANRVSRLPGPKLRLHSSLVVPVIEERREDIEWMEARLGVSLAEDLDAHDEGAIRSEEDLLKFSPETLQWLAEELGKEHVKRWRPEMNPSEVAEWMHHLRLKLSAADDGAQKTSSDPFRTNRFTGEQSRAAHQAGNETVQMTINDLIRSARQSAPELQGVADDNAQSLLREVFGQVRRKIEGSYDTAVKVDGLGLFRIRGPLAQGRRNTPLKRIGFRAVK